MYKPQLSASTDTRNHCKTVYLARRFKCPDSFDGYGIERERSIHYTSNSEYGKYPPSVFTVPLRYYPQNHHFSRLMFTTKRRSLSLN